MIVKDNVVVFNNLLNSKTNQPIQIDHDMTGEDVTQLISSYEKGLKSAQNLFKVLNP